ncbi:glutamine synthetase family protein [Aeromicrobium fastidiosum]|uniref:glutamine synthetase n=1 Tax=Aeromicrobium fastidiosum TaxID=52699 RepID=A0A641AR58_9ACTN|nr:glutamine synthetase family protein [Aeromicrobium fastidiosum]KAA1380594.1 glutamine synthetase [Aeromicrobium fastidiosum]MBP2390193.1 glutamine synthetase [Aeromicrobium fastidiosum]
MHPDLAGLEQAQRQLEEQGIDVVRVGYADLIGADRGRDVLVSHFGRTVGGGLAFCRSVFATTPGGEVVDFEGGMSDGLPDVKVVPDLSTLRPVPWEPGVAHCIADVFDPDGTPSAEGPRHVLRQLLAEFAALGLSPIIGPELEFFVLEKSDKTATGWHRYGEATGNVYTAGLKGDPDSITLETLRTLGDYGLDVISANHEFSSGQFEINLWHGEALDAADRAHRFKTAIKELAHRRGQLATFMPKPFNDEGGSGYHLHFSMLDDQGNALFDDPSAPHGLSTMAQHAIGGILAHAPAAAALSNPTINSYKRFGPDTLAPWLIDWGLDNRSAMLRIPPERGAASRIELRLGDASANSYLVIAAMLAAALLGIRNEIEPPEPLVGYGYDVAKAAQLPSTLATALDALEADQEMTALLGPKFVAAFLAYKRDEVARFQRWTTDWEFAEYAYHI